MRVCFWLTFTNRHCNERRCLALGSNDFRMILNDYNNSETIDLPEPNSRYTFILTDE
jgi:hypothetical protein